MAGNGNGWSATPSNWPNNPNRPVEKVSWDDVQIFLNRLNNFEQIASPSSRDGLVECFAHRVPMGVRLPCDQFHFIFLG